MPQFRWWHGCRIHHKCARCHGHTTQQYKNAWNAKNYGRYFLLVELIPISEHPPSSFSSSLCGNVAHSIAQRWRWRCRRLALNIFFLFGAVSVWCLTNEPLEWLFDSIHVNVRQSRGNTWTNERIWNASLHIAAKWEALIEFWCAVKRRPWSNVHDKFWFYILSKMYRRVSHTKINQIPTCNASLRPPIRIRCSWTWTPNGNLTMGSMTQLKWININIFDGFRWQFNMIPIWTRGEWTKASKIGRKNKIKIKMEKHEQTVVMTKEWKCILVA